MPDVVSDRTRAPQHARFVRVGEEITQFAQPYRSKSDVRELTRADVEARTREAFDYLSENGHLPTWGDSFVAAIVRPTPYFLKTKDPSCAYMQNTLAMMIDPLPSETQTKEDFDWREDCWEKYDAVKLRKNASGTVTVILRTGKMIEITPVDFPGGKRNGVPTVLWSGFVKRAFEGLDLRRDELKRVNDAFKQRIGVPAYLPGPFHSDGRNEIHCDEGTRRGKKEASLEQGKYDPTDTQGEVDAGNWMRRA